MNLKIMIPLVSLLGLSGCCGGGCAYSEFRAGLNQTISDGRNSYKVTEVKWSDSLILIKTELHFHNIDTDLDDYRCVIYYENMSGDDWLLSPFNIEETNLRNETQMDSDYLLSIKGEYTFAYDQVLEDTADFIADENAYIMFCLPVFQTGISSSFFEIQNEDVTFVTE